MAPRSAEFAPPARAVARGRRVSLHVAHVDDAHDIVAAAQASARLHASWVRAPKTLAEFARYLARLDGARTVGLVVRRRDDRAPVGIVNLNEIVRGALASAYVGYYAFAAQAGRGLMREGLEAACRYAFGRLRLHRLEINVQPANERSIELAKAIGFSLEGFSPRYLRIAGRWRDHLRFALLREEFQGRYERAPRDAGARAAKVEPGAAKTRSKSRGTEKRTSL